MKEKMNYSFIPSLKHRTLVKISAALWNRSDIRDLVAKCSPKFYRYTAHFAWQELQDRVIGLVPKLPLPESLIKEMIDLVQQMFLEVKKWKEYYIYETGFIRCLCAAIPSELYWTPQGTVDHKKIAEVLIKDENIDLITRYGLACIWCLEDDIKNLWNLMPQTKKECIYLYGNYFKGKSKLIMLWTYAITGESTVFHDFIREIAEREVSPCQFQFEYAVEHAIKATAEYFLQKLTPRERDESLVKCATDLANKHLSISIAGNYKYDNFEKYDAEILCFLLSQMDVEQQKQLLTDNPAGVLSCLLDWPWESFFMETANRVWGVLSQDHYELLLKVMVRRVIAGYKNCNYHKLFKEFWQQSPDTHKKYVSDRLTSGFLLSDLFQAEDKENIRLLFKNVTLEEREEIIFSCKGMDICKSLIHINKWDLLKFFIQECICVSSKDKMFQIEGELRAIVSSISEESADDLWTDFSQFLDDLHEDNEKRNVEEGNSCPRKKPKFN